LIAYCATRLAASWNDRSSITRLSIRVGSPSGLPTPILSHGGGAHHAESFLSIADCAREAHQVPSRGPATAAGSTVATAGDCPNAL
jgi:hypothetical protein